MRLLHEEPHETTWSLHPVNISSVQGSCLHAPLATWLLASHRLSMAMRQVEGFSELTMSAVLEGMPPEDLMASKLLWGSTESAASLTFAFVLS